LKGLEEVGLLDGVDSVSAVSGGSLFGAAWVISKKNGTQLDAFLAIMANELAKGFVGRSLKSWRRFCPFGLLVKQQAPGGLQPAWRLTLNP
jgi:hypothetical protein